MTEDTKPQAELTDSISDPSAPVVAAVNTTSPYIILHATDGDRRHVRVEKYSFESYPSLFLCVFLSLCDRKGDKLAVIVSACTPLTTRYSLSVLVWSLSDNLC